MKKTVLISALLLPGFVNASPTKAVMVDRFNAGEYGINFKAVEEMFSAQAEVSLKWEEVLNVRADQEGKNLNFRTFDGYSIDVPVEILAVAPNKGDR